MIKAVVFDLDDTLYPEQQYVLCGFQAVGDWLADRYELPDFYETAAGLFAAGTRGDIFDMALKQSGMNPERDLVQNLVQVYREHRPALKLYEDAEWAIDRFRASRKLGVITDGYLAVQKNKVEALGILRYFDVVCYSDQYGRECWKPSPVPYLQVMEALSCAGEECVYVADNPGKDFVTARKLGWMTVQICRPGGEYAHIVPGPGCAARYEISSLYELGALIPE